MHCGMFSTVSMSGFHRLDVSSKLLVAVVSSEIAKCPVEDRVHLG